jgi:hypothetical protein
MGGSRQRKCRICKKRPPWQYKNCPPGICKRCYHSKVWPQRPGRAKADQEPELLESDLADFLPEPSPAAASNRSARNPESSPR